MLLSICAKDSVLFYLLGILKAENGIKKRCFIIIFKITFLVTPGNWKKNYAAAKIIKDTAYIEMP